MYAEQFNAPSWLEEPAKWLWWGMQSRIAGRLEDATYNLQAFWKELEKTKANANEATWPEILALDSQSHIQAANITGAIINEMENDLSKKAGWIRFFSGTIYKNWSAQDQGGPIRRMQDQRTAELKTAAALAEQARTATANRAQAVAEYRLDADTAERAQENTQIEKILRDDSGEFLGVPLWAWIAGAAGLLLLVTRR